MFHQPKTNVRGPHKCALRVTCNPRDGRCPGLVKGVHVGHKSIMYFMIIVVFLPSIFMDKGSVKTIL
jgi:hypothetical protein